MPLNRRNFTRSLFLTPLLLSARRSEADTIVCTQITSAPFVITDPGTYCLANDLVVNSNCGPAIEFRTTEAMLDLNGHTISLAPDVQSTAPGIYINPAYYGLNGKIRILNGAIKGFFSGIHGTNLAFSNFKNLEISDFTGTGISFNNLYQTVIENVRFTMSTKSLATISCGFRIGIGIKNGRFNVIENNQFTFLKPKLNSNANPVNGIAICNRSTTCTLRNNLVFNAKFGIIQDDSNSKLFDNYVVGALNNGAIIGGTDIEDNAIVYE